MLSHFDYNGNRYVVNHKDGGYVFNDARYPNDACRVAAVDCPAVRNAIEPEFLRLLRAAVAEAERTAIEQFIDTE